MNDTNLNEAETVEKEAEAAPIADVAEAAPPNVSHEIEQSLPDSLRESRARATRQEHPAGEVFFRGEAEQMTDAEAEEVARKQLERSGLLRGQRVRVAD